MLDKARGTYSTEKNNSILLIICLGSDVRWSVISGGTISKPKKSTLITSNKEKRFVIELIRKTDMLETFK